MPKKSTIWRAQFSHKLVATLFSLNSRQFFSSFNNNQDYIDRLAELLKTLRIYRHLQLSVHPAFLRVCFVLMFVGQNFTLLWAEPKILHKQKTKEIIAVKEFLCDKTQSHRFSLNICLDFLGLYITSILKIIS